MSTEVPSESTDDQLTVPEDNLPGHHPATEQDKPDADAFVRRFEGLPDEPTVAERARDMATHTAEEMRRNLGRWSEESRRNLGQLRRNIASSLRRLAVIVDKPDMAYGSRRTSPDGDTADD